MKYYEAKINYTFLREEADTGVHSSAEIVALMAGVFEQDPFRESVWVLCMNRKNKLISRHQLSIGTANATLVTPQDVMRIAIMSMAQTFCIVHNHPSGDPTPSTSDIVITRRIREAADIMDIPFLDHVIIGAPLSDPLGKGYYSFREAGMI